MNIINYSEMPIYIDISFGINIDIFVSTVGILYYFNNDKSYYKCLIRENYYGVLVYMIQPSMQELKELEDECFISEFSPAELKQLEKHNILL